ncbi:DNA polymerase ligase N-terminal domain-containing protein [Streptomyces sp. NPDC006475]|uniref:DNA polymerase ligase N-terminal domain-containing protein n=1 Tax=unclassified Streptomyces TaxID=2593676 RepID=UPI0033BAD729|nr:3'-phosphoesterase [Streptomyces sp. NBC_01167]
MAGKDELSEYRRKRDFDKTREPQGGAPASGSAPRFVVQLHDARSVHFDFRLEVDGVLKSWAIPKGPSHDPHDKRLAMPTEDHPLDYRDFEGVIPEGQYGGGTVIIWDEGTYRPKGSPEEFEKALEKGHASFWLDGRKLHGGYALTRFRGGDGDDDREAWMLVKRNDTHASDQDAPDPKRARSARSGRTLGQIAADPDADRWESNRS